MYLLFSPLKSNSTVQTKPTFYLLTLSPFLLLLKPFFSFFHFLSLNYWKIFYQKPNGVKKGFQACVLPTIFKVHFYFHTFSLQKLPFFVLFVSLSYLGISWLHVFVFCVTLILKKKNKFGICMGMPILLFTLIVFNFFSCCWLFLCNL